MGMWINWCPFQNVENDYKLTTTDYKLFKAHIIRMSTGRVVYVFKDQNQIGIYNKDSSVTLQIFYPTNISLVKFKTKNNTTIKINMDEYEIETDDDVWRNQIIVKYSTTFKENYIELTIPARTIFPYCWEWGIYDINQEPYYWTTPEGESWTPAELSFPNMINNSTMPTKYGIAEDIPGTVNDIIQDKFGNNVSPVLLSKVAQKITLNRGFRCNDQVLETIAYTRNTVAELSSTIIQDNIFFLIS